MDKNRNNGLSARQQTIYHPGTATLKTGCSFTILMSLTVMMAIGSLTVSCQPGRSKETAYLAKDSVASSDSLKKPDVKIQVNRKYDDKGNLVAFDSTYSSFYSNVQGDTVRMDSLMKSFDTYFGRQHSRLFDQQFNKLFFNDSLAYPDFFHQDFFMKRYELNDRYLRGMMHRMDSIKNRFYNETDKLSMSKRKE
ncbi:MAG TPA: hypothetical protein VFE50_14820 [Cyclobacteriaceae bacterium]|nr:hypothetical protein [Cyclobacteriaceae bacterium]